MSQKKSKRSTPQASVYGVKAPQDFKEKIIPFSQVPGHELLIPLDQLPIEKAFDLVAIFEGITEEGDFSISQLRPLLSLIREGGFIADEEGFARFAVASNFSAFIQLVTAYVGEVSKDIS